MDAIIIALIVGGGVVALGLMIGLGFALVRKRKLEPIVHYEEKRDEITTRKSKAKLETYSWGFFDRIPLSSIFGGIVGLSVTFFVLSGVIGTVEQTMNATSSEYINKTMPPEMLLSSNNVQSVISLLPILFMIGTVFFALSIATRFMR